MHGKPTAGKPAEIVTEILKLLNSPWYNGRRRGGAAGTEATRAQQNTASRGTKLGNNGRLTD